MLGPSKANRGRPRPFGANQGAGYILELFVRKSSLTDPTDSESLSVLMLAMLKLLLY